MYKSMVLTRSQYRFGECRPASGSGGSCVLTSNLPERLPQNGGILRVCYFYTSFNACCWYASSLLKFFTFVITPDSHLIYSGDSDWCRSNVLVLVIGAQTHTFGSGRQIGIGVNFQRGEYDDTWKQVGVLDVKASCIK